MTYDRWLYDRTPAHYLPRDRMWVALRAYNGGLGHWRGGEYRAHAADPNGDAACGKARRAAVHCRENLGYPHRILVVIQPRYLQWRSLVMSLSIRSIAIGLAIAGAIVGVKLWQAHLISQGACTGRSPRAKRLGCPGERAQCRHGARQRNQVPATPRGTAHEDAKREAARRVRVAAAADVVRGLRDEIARLNSRPDPYPAGDAGLTACAGEARTARATRRSAGAYQELAAEADGLRDQVTGLQDFCPQCVRRGQDGGTVD